MKKLALLLLIVLLPISYVFSTVIPDPVKFSVEFGKEGVYEFSFYDYSLTNSINSLVFNPKDVTALHNTDYTTNFGVKWNIISALDYSLLLEFSSESTGVDGKDFMLKRVSSDSSIDSGYNFSYSYTVDDATKSVELESAEIATKIGSDTRTDNKRIVTLKTGSASDTERTGSSKVDLTLKAPSGGSFTQGQYIGYVRLILEVG